MQWIIKSKFILPKLVGFLVVFGFLGSATLAGASVMVPQHVYTGTVLQNGTEQNITGAFSIPASHRGFNFSCTAKMLQENNLVAGDFTIMKKTAGGNIPVFKRSTETDWPITLSELILGEGDYFLAVSGNNQSFALLQYTLEDTPVMPNYQLLGEYKGLKCYVNVEWSKPIESAGTEKALDVWLKILPTPESADLIHNASYVITNGTFKSTENTWLEQKRLYFNKQNDITQTLSGPELSNNPDMINQGCKVVLEKYFTFNPMILHK